MCVLTRRRTDAQSLTAPSSCAIPPDGTSREGIVGVKHACPIRPTSPSPTIVRDRRSPGRHPLGLCGYHQVLLLTGPILNHVVKVSRSRPWPLQVVNLTIDGQSWEAKCGPSIPQGPRVEPLESCLPKERISTKEEAMFASA